MGATTGTPPPPTPELQCEKCGSVTAPGSTSCPVCGSPIAVPLPATAPLDPALAAPAQAVAAPEREKASIWIPVKLAAVPVMALAVTWLAERNAPPGEAIGYWIGTMLLPTLIAFIGVGFKPARRMRTFSTVFCVVGVIGLGAMLASVERATFARQKTPKELAQEAAGTKPTTESGTPSERKMDRLLREFMSDVLAARKKHDADAAPLAPILATLYTPQSFSGKQQMDDMVTTLKKILEIDGEMMSKFERLPQEFQARLDASDLNSSDKEDVMRGFEKGYGGSGIPAAYHEIRSAEEQWEAASVDLYTFASQHASSIKIQGQKIVVADADVLSEFNDKLQHSRDLRKKVHEGNQRLAALQAAATQKTGITKGDLGLK
jgi:hypothetical protein